MLPLQIYDKLEVGQPNKAPSTEIRTLLGSNSNHFFAFFMHKKKQFLCAPFMKQFMTASSDFEMLVMESPKSKRNYILSSTELKSHGYI